MTLKIFTFWRKSWVFVVLGFLGVRRYLASFCLNYLVNQPLTFPKVCSWKVDLLYDMMWLYVFTIYLWFYYLMQPSMFLFLKKTNHQELQEGLNTSKLNLLSMSVSMHVRPAMPVPVHLLVIPAGPFECRASVSHTNQTCLNLSLVCAFKYPHILSLLNAAVPTAVLQIH